MKKWLFLIAAIALEVTGSLSLKASLDTPFFYILVVAGYLGAFLALSMSLRGGMGLGVGYGIWGASGVAFTALMSRLVLDEPITPLMTVGILLVMVGVLMVEFGARTARQNSDNIRPA